MGEILFHTGLAIQVIDGVEPDGGADIGLSGAGTIGGIKPDPTEILDQGLGRLGGEHLGADRAYYVEIDEAHKADVGARDEDPGQPGAHLVGGHVVGGVNLHFLPWDVAEASYFPDANRLYDPALGRQG